MSVIRAPHLLLRPFEDSDAAAFAVAVRESVSSVGPWMPWCHAQYTDSDALDWFRVARETLSRGTAHEFGVFSADGRHFLGGAGLNQINTQHKYCNLGYWVRQSEQRKGVALACVHALAEHAFTDLQLHRVEIVAAVGNEPSVGVARKAGAQFECTARNKLFLHGSPVAANVFSLVPGDIRNKH
jgi:RimJ/RimL family protein N-acetyltransferase